jgi:hypothetical protein
MTPWPPEADRILSVEGFRVSELEQTVLRQDTAWLPLWWCLPSLLGFVAFLFSFPIDRQIPFRPHLSLAEILALWFLFITPVTTVIAIVMLVKRNRIRRIPPFTKLLLWAAIAASLLVNAFVLLGMWASTF